MYVSTTDNLISHFLRKAPKEVDIYGIVIQLALSNKFNRIYIKLFGIRFNLASSKSATINGNKSIKVGTGLHLLFQVLLREVLLQVGVSRFPAFFFNRRVYFNKGYNIYSTVAVETNFGCFDVASVVFDYLLKEL